MTDVVPLNLDQQRLDFPYDNPIFPPYFNNTPANTTMPTQPILNLNPPTSYDFDLTDQNQSHTSSSQQQQTSNEMAAANSFSGQQQYSDVDNSSQHIQPSLESPSYVEPTVNYSYASTSTSNSMNNFDNNNPSTNNKYPSRSFYYGNYHHHHHPYLDHSYHYPSHSPHLINNYNNLRHRIYYQGSPPPYGRKLSSGPIDTNIPNVSYSRPENVTTASLPTTNLNLYYPTGNAIVPSFDLSSTIITTKPTTAPTTIAIPQNSTNSVTSSSESESPTKKTYSYSGPPKSYYSRLPLYDRPFKCDTCPQSFNRNHDLKRHKRIHLAVKPYPCPYCDKQFSRKDALKRHIMVKGCNNTNNNNTANNKKNSNNNKIAEDDLTNSPEQKYESIESENPIKSEPTSDNNVHNNYI